MRVSRWVGFLALALSVVTASMVLGCGGEEAPRPPPAGRQPLPSSEPPRAAPSGSGSSTPMFARGGTGSRSAALARTPMIREEMERQEREARARGPIRIGGQEADGRAFGQELQAAAVQAESDDICEQAWAAQAVARERAGARVTPADEREYLRGCRAMPEAERNCTSPLYVRDHTAECEQIHQDAMERLQRQGTIPRSRAQLP